MLTTHSGY